MSTSAAERKPSTILVIDDDQDMQVLVESALAEDGHRVAVAAETQSALEQMDQGLVPELILLDLGLPGMGGLEFLGLVQRRYPYIKIVVISGNDTVDSIVEAMRLGALDFVRKPFDIITVKVAVNEALQFRQLQMTLDRQKRRDVFHDEMSFMYASSAMAEIMETIQQISDTNVPVLITGESGVGKEVVAREIHQRSDRAGKPFVKINCAALPASLLEGELFGFERGAFTGAVKAKPSKFEKAGGGTLFLDEIGEIEHGIQAKFLHVLQDGRFSRLGSNKMVQSDARIIVATNRDIEDSVRLGKFRSDLYYRLNVIRIHIPPLRERPADIPILAEHFLAMNRRKFGKVVRFDEATKDFIRGYSWPGNVRELQNAVSRYVVLGRLGQDVSGGRSLSTMGKFTAKEAELPVNNEGARAQEKAPLEGRTLKEIARDAARKAERTAILRALEMTRWNKSKAARMLRISYKALLYKIKDCGIEAEDSIG